MAISHQLSRHRKLHSMKIKRPSRGFLPLNPRHHQCLGHL
jgi:hypothetical protein